MNLTFDSITLRNFGSFAEATFAFSDYSAGLNFIRGRNEYEPRIGSNGSGKSTLWNALCWGLYGKAVDGRRNPDVRSWFANGTTEVTIKLRADNKKHTITRTIQPNKLLLNGNAAGQDQIEKLIDLSFETFTHTILLGQGQDLFFDLSPSDKMHVFSEALGLERWSIRSKIASERASEIQQELDHKSGELAGIDKLLDHLDTSITTAKKNAQSWMDERNEKLREHEKELKAVEKQLAEQQSRLDNATLAAEGAGTEYGALSKELDALKSKIANDERTQFELQLAKKVATEAIGDLRTQLIMITKEGKCPTCGQTIKKLDQHKHKQEIKDKIAGHEKECIDLSRKLSSNLTSVAVGHKRRTTLQASHYKFKKTFDQSMADISLYQRMCNEFKIKAATLKHTISELELNKNPYSEQVRGLIKQQTKVSGQHRDLTNDIDKLRQRLERTRFWIKGFKDVQLYVIDEVLQELELVSNSMLPDIGLDDWKITYSVERETQQGNVQRNLNVLITSPSNEKPVSFKCWSGGEGQRLRIIGALALSDVLLNHASVAPNLEILDEPTRSLSVEGVNDLCPFLADRAQSQNKQIYLVDHMSVPSADFSSIITVVKNKDGVSNVTS
jgi:DNA repair exonuclease SbcCD ATPase subunit